MSNYEIRKLQFPDRDNLVRIDDDGKEWVIPMDESNSDYQRYLRWLENPDAEENGTIS
jgi:hypothetical protein